MWAWCVVDAQEAHESRVKRKRSNSGNWEWRRWVQGKGVDQRPGVRKRKLFFFWKTTFT